MDKNVDGEWLQNLRAQTAKVPLHCMGAHKADFYWEMCENLKILTNR